MLSTIHTHTHKETHTSQRQSTLTNVGEQFNFKLTAGNITTTSTITTMKIPEKNA